MTHCYKLNGYNIVIDAASGSVHSVDEAAYDAIRMFEDEGADETARYIGARYPDLEHSEIAKLMSDIEALKRQGKLFAEDATVRLTQKTRAAPAKAATAPPTPTAPTPTATAPTPTATAPTAPPTPPVKALCLNVAHICNMTCGYCFASAGWRGRDAGEALMSLETGRQSIDFLVANSGNRKNLYVDFFGGEPLLNLGAVKGIVKYARGIESTRGKRFLFTLTTNGLLIDDEVIEFANKEMDNVVLSLDGRPEVNDAMRKLGDGSGSYSEVLPKFKKLVEARGGKNYYIRGTYTQANLDFATDILHLADLGFTELSLEPVVSPPGTLYALQPESLPALCEQYELLASEMLKRGGEGRGFTFYHYMIDLAGGPCVYKRIAGCGVGTEYLAVTPDGSLYPCHRFIGNPAFHMGDVSGGIANDALRAEFERCSVLTRPGCRKCWAKLYCGGGCTASAYEATGTITGTYDFGCELFKKRMECAIMMRIAERNVNHYE